MVLRVHRCCLGGDFLPPDALLPEHGQMFALEVQVHQREVRAQPMMVLCNASVAHLVEAEDALQDAKYMFHLGSDFRLSCIFTPFYFVHIIFESGSATSHIGRSRQPTHR